MPGPKKYLQQTVETEEKKKNYIYMPRLKDRSAFMKLNCKLATVLTQTMHHFKLHFNNNMFIPRWQDYMIHKHKP
jgi:hypothetical protein